MRKGRLALTRAPPARENRGGCWPASAADRPSPQPPRARVSRERRCGSTRFGDREVGRPPRPALGTRAARSGFAAELGRHPRSRSRRLVRRSDGVRFRAEGALARARRSRHEARAGSEGPDFGHGPGTRPADTPPSSATTSRAARSASRRLNASRNCDAVSAWRCGAAPGAAAGDKSALLRPRRSGGNQSAGSEAIGRGRVSQSLSRTTPITTATLASVRLTPKRSPKKSAPISAATMTLVSRSAATPASAAWSWAQITVP
jgi:hypothetical protein